MYIEKVDIGSVNVCKKTIHHIETLFELNLSQDMERKVWV